MLKLWSFLRRRWWNQTGMFARSVIKASRETRTCRCTGGAIRSHGSSSRDHHHHHHHPRLPLIIIIIITRAMGMGMGMGMQMWIPWAAQQQRCHRRHRGSVCTCVLSQVACTMTRLMHWAIWWASRSTTGGNTAAWSSGSATSATRPTPSNPTTRRTSRLVAPGATATTVAASSPGTYRYLTYLSILIPPIPIPILTSTSTVFFCF